MFSLLTLSRPLIISLSIVSIIGIVSAAYFQFSGTAGTTHIFGQFFSDGTTGNAGIVSFQGGGNAGIDGDRLTGTFYSQTIGVIVFNSDARITPPSTGKVTDLWSVVGTASSNAGTIDLTGVQYNPVSRSLSGYGMNYGVGRVPFGIAATLIDPATGLPVTLANSITSTGISIGFQGRVKVLGSIGGNSAFDTFYGIGSQVHISLMTATLNRIRQNIALLSRNISVSAMNTAFNDNISVPIGNKIFYINTGSTIKTLTYNTTHQSDFPTATNDSLIIVGGDLVITTAIGGPTKARPNGIIVLKNTAGVGGNIIIQGSVKTIESSMFAEGSIYSGTGMTALANDTAGGVATLPENQLYVHGSVMSHNTIGGSFATPATCPYTETACTSDRAIRYDLNYFRNYLSGTTSTRAYTNNTYDGYSLIIELDPRIASAPPPGF